ncbi:hypothetical protein Aab01nite_52960 [Paractinoplanes abujensis]|uniref:Uncharacterized protein n=1 Tax=Paractinoplanes abujensis TaxID=882441 RepID=A0A7W7CVA8_9ACTN|nr:hypothetical protein [Actinoplanes abujensis]MBB4693636.1 hypothetical protein [Actinoplanes abujensis]GID21706.1 hypothetical protein Aab01nite_52960 [Actinoplanes abujensis]
MTVLTFVRAPDAAALARRMTFLLDGRPVARLKRGESVRVTVPAGRHVVQARMDWLRSRPLDLTLGEAETLSVTGALTEHSMTFTGAFLRPSTALEIRAA